MILSFVARVLCVAAIMSGLIHFGLEVLLWLFSSKILRIAESLPARLRERLLYTMQLVPLAAALLLTCAVCMPRYILSESNHDAESVGWMCVACALAVGIWYSATVLRGLVIAGRTILFAQSCRKAAKLVSVSAARTPVFSYPGKAYSVALVGLFRPFILVSDGLLGDGGLSRSAIEVVLDHELSHATHHDNWKLFSLSCIPTLGLSLGNGRSWNTLWRAAAEWAADDDAVLGDNARVLVLAETLVAVARRGASQPQRICMALECGQSDLAARVGRLIDHPKQVPASASKLAPWWVAAAAVALVSATAGMLLSSHDLLERLMHLGQG